ncbi:MAG: superoxide dismutase family protein [Burkholderiales bacterium]
MTRGTTFGALTGRVAGWALAAALLAGCSASMKEEMSTMFPDNAGLIARLRSPSSAVTGSVRVVDYRDGVSVQIAISNLIPGQYRVTLNENGNCSSFNLFSAGPAWAPAGMKPDELLPGFLANEDGSQNGYVAFIKGVSTDGPNSVRGRSVVIHWGSRIGEAIPGQPNNRVACGVLESARGIL